MAVPVHYILAGILLPILGCCHCLSQAEIELEQCYETICWNDENDFSPEIRHLIKRRLEEENAKNSNAFGTYQEQIAGTFPLQETSCSMCKHKTSLRVSPVVLRDNDNRYFVVRTSHYQQNITLNICESESEQIKHSPCMKLLNSQEGRLNQEMACEQKSTMMKLLVYDPKKDIFEHKILQYPSACVCTIQKIL